MYNVQFILLCMCACVCICSDGLSIHFITWSDALHTEVVGKLIPKLYIHTLTIDQQQPKEGEKNTKKKVIINKTEKEEGNC